VPTGPTRCGFCAIIGAPNAGKSTLVNQLTGSKVSIVSHKVQTTRARIRAIAINGDAQIVLVDTPGIDVIASAARARLAARVALGSDLVLLVFDADLGRVEIEALETLLASGKPLLLVLNRSDCWPADELPALQASIRRRLPAAAAHLEPIVVAAAPQQPRLLADGRVRSEAAAPRIAPLEEALLDLLERHGRLLLAQGEIDICVLGLSGETRGLGHCARRQNCFAHIIGWRVEGHGAHGEPVAVGGRHGESIRPDAHENAGEYGAGLVAGCGAHDAVGTCHEALRGDGETQPVIGRQLGVLTRLVAVEAER
jgi:small GTP-binding protein